MVQLTAMMVRALAGAPITILVLLLLERKPLTQEYIERHTGYSDKTIHTSVLLLKDYGMVSQVGRYEWQALPGAAAQLPLGVEEREELATEVTEEEEKKEFIRDEEDKGDEGREIRSEPFRAALESSGGSIDIKTIEYIPPPESRRDRSEQVRAEPDEGVLQACDECGIEEPARSKLARRVGVSAEMVRTHCAEAPTIGAAIWRLEHGWRGRRSAKDQEKNERSKYVGGEFGEYIVH